MVTGCGIDIVEKNRFDKYLNNLPKINSFLEMVFTHDEITNNVIYQPHKRFPLGFACKEAVFKAFGVSWMNSMIDWKDIELIFDNQSDQYEIKLSGFAKQLYDQKDIDNISSTLIEENNFVLFFCKLIKKCEA